MDPAQVPIHENALSALDLLGRVPGAEDGWYPIFPGHHSTMGEQASNICYDAFCRNEKRGPCRVRRWCHDYLPLLKRTEVLGASYDPGRSGDPATAPSYTLEDQDGIIG